MTRATYSRVLQRTNEVGPYDEGYIFEGPLEGMWM